jgi:predicted nucleic acid-binding protein
LRRIAVIDSSTLISLVHLGLAMKLNLYFNVILVPRRVHEEVNKKGRFRSQIRKLYASRLFERCVVADEARIELLRDLDPGEAEALAQAQDKGASFFIGDDKSARAIAEKRRLKPVGTVRILAKLHWDKFADDPRLLVGRLQKGLKFRVTQMVVNEAMAKAHEPI